MLGGSPVQGGFDSHAAPLGILTMAIVPETGDETDLKHYDAWETIAASRLGR